MGWPYVFGARGQYDTPAYRRQRANAVGGAEGNEIRNKCQYIRDKLPKNTCVGCKWYPGGKTRCYDCRGFTYWVLLQVGVKIMGAGATSQWDTKSNWTRQGEISGMPLDKVCCVFMRKGSKMSHTGLYVGNGVIIHCSGEVKTDKITNTKWTHYAVPKGLNGTVPVPPPTPVKKPTIKKGSTGPYVVECQKDLIFLGYDLGAAGADGKFGVKTQKAVKSFQGSHNDKYGKPLKVDGIVGELTWDALDTAVKNKETTL